MHKHNFGQTLKLQSAVVTVNIRSRSLKSKSSEASFDILSKKQITKALIRLRIGWSTPSLFANPEDRFSCTRSARMF